MDVGTSKPTAAERRGIPHHLIDVVEPWESMNLARFVECAHAARRDVAARGRVPVAVGGTMMYLHGFLNGVFTGPVADFAVREPAEGEVGKTLTITLKYGQNRERSIAGVRRISKPGLRVYAKSTGLPKVLGGLGVAIISTSQGLLTDRQANQKGVGGEVLAYVW